MVKRIAAFCFLCMFSFCSVVDAWAQVTSTTAIINRIINSTVGVASDFAGGVNIARTSALVVDGLSIPFTIAESATAAEVAAGGVAAAIASPVGLAAAAIIAAALLYGWYKCAGASSGWCKSMPSTIETSYGWKVGQGPAAQFTKASAQQAASDFCTSAFSSASTVAELKPDPGFSPDVDYDASDTFKCVLSDGSMTGSQIAYHHAGTASQGGVEVQQATDPVHSPEALTLTQRAMAENKLLPSALANAAQADGHPIDDPQVNPQIQTQVKADPVAGPKTQTTNTASDGTKTDTTCIPTNTLSMINGGDNRVAQVGAKTATNCTIVTTAPDGTTKTSYTAAYKDPAAQDAKPATGGPVECGSPGKPPCKIDEAGTPTATEAKTSIDPASQSVKDSTDTAKAAIDGLKTLDDNKFKWNFTLQFPNTCSSLPLFLNIVIDFCKYQPMVHDLMGMVWAGGTFFAIANKFGRVMRGGA